MSRVAPNTVADEILQDSWHTGSLVVCVGPRISHAAGFPTWQDYLAHFTLEDKPEKGSAALRRFYTEVFPLYSETDAGESHAIDTSLYSALARLPARAYITTNFDSILEEQITKKGGVFPRVVLTDTDLPYPGDPNPWVFKLRGSWERPATIKLGINEFPSHQLGGSGIDVLLRPLLSGSLVLFIGYRIDDPDFERLYQLYSGGGTNLRNWFVLSDPVDRLTEQLWRSRGVRVLSVDQKQLTQVLDVLASRLLHRELPVTGKKNNVLFVSSSDDFEEYFPLLDKAASKVKLKLLPFHQQLRPGLTMLENIERVAESATAAIVVLPAQNWERRFSNERARSEAMLELGFLIARLGADRVLVIARETSDLHPDLLAVPFVLVDPIRPSVAGFELANWLTRLARGSRGKQ